ncbi:glycosyltransferase [Demequina sediminicola]|uniref:glycosyltransferase n=1 Tax=Demequina sediminicola TaxID=1095026 RepID=UPI0007836AD3|nr:glycosyltransferase [Demequina sediminicola]
MTKHLLYIAWGFAPARTGGVYRAVATANAFVEAGWKVTVLAAPEDSYERYIGVDMSMNDAVDPRVNVVRVPFTWATQETDVREFSRARAYLGSRSYNRIRSRLDRIPFPEHNYGQWRGALEDAVEKVHAEDPVDLTIATANPNVDFQGAYHLNRKAGVPFVMDYRDGWRLDVFDGGYLFPEKSRVARLEKRYLEAAQEAWFVNDAIRVWHQKEYPFAADKMQVVMNGWDPALFGEREAATPPADGPMRFGYLGTITPKVPLESLMKGWTLAKEQGHLPADATLEVGGYLGYFATPRGDLAAVLDAARDAGVTFVGQVHKGQVRDFYARQDALVLALGEGRYVTSGKVFEYAATGKPIISVHAPTNDSSNVLREYPLWTAVPEVTPEAIATTLGETVTQLKQASAEDYAAALTFGEALRRDAQLAPRIDALATEVSA